MAKSLAAITTLAAPYLELRERDGPGDQGSIIAVYPKVIKAPRKLKASRDLSLLAMVSDLRIEDLPAIGNPAEGVPTTGLRLIHWNDRWVLFGGSAGVPPRLYERAGPVFAQTRAYDLADWPTGTYFSSAAFSMNGRFLFAVRADDADTVQVYQWTSDDPEDPRAVWELKDPLEIGVSIVGLEISPLNNFLIAKLSDLTFRLFDIQNLLAPISPVPAGEFLTMTPDETEWVLAPSGGEAEVYSQAAGAFALISSLGNSNGTDRKAAYAPDGLVLAINGRPSSGTAMPQFYARGDEGEWIAITSHAHAGAATWETSGFAFKSDSQQMIFTHNDGGQRAEVYERAIITPDEFTAAASPFTGTTHAPTTGPRPERSHDGSVVATSSGVYLWDGEALADITPSGYASSANDLSVSGDGQFIARTGGTSVSVWKRSGDTFVPAPGITATTGLYLKAMSLSRDGRFAVINASTAPFGNGTLELRVMERDEGDDTWSQTSSTVTLWTVDSVIMLRAKSLWHPNRDDLFVIPGYATGGQTFGMHPLVYLLAGGAWTLQAALPAPAGYNVYYGFNAWSPNGKFLAGINRNNLANGFLLVVYELTGDTFTLHHTAPLFVATAGAPQQLAWSPDGRYIIYGRTTGTRTTDFFFNEGTDDDPAFVAVEGPSDLAATAAVTGVLWTSGSLTLFGSSAIWNHWNYQVPEGHPSYLLLHTFVGPAGGLPPLDGYSFDESVIHFGGETWAQHPYSEDIETPTYPTELSFAPQYAVDDIWGVLMSKSGKTVLYETAAGIGLAQRRNTGSNFLNSETLRGCFVNLYDREGDQYTERGYSIYDYGTIIKDLTFAPNGEVLAYHVDPIAEAAVDAPRGRLIYDISGDRFEFRGQVWEAEMTNSLMAFSADTTAFVVTHEHLVANTPFISLHEFGADYVFTQTDSEPVAFGPPDFSLCDDVVVAHGGSPQMTFFTYASPDLIPNPKAINWDYEGVILAIGFRENCDGIVIVTPDEIVIMEPDIEDPETLEPEVEEPLEEEIEEPEDDDGEYPDIEVDGNDSDGSTITIRPNPVRNPWYPGDYDYTPGTPKPVNNISFVPYVSVTVTFRVMSIPQ